MVTGSLNPGTKRPRRIVDHPFPSSFPTSSSCKFQNTGTGLYVNRRILAPHHPDCRNSLIYTRMTLRTLHLLHQLRLAVTWARSWRISEINPAIPSWYRVRHKCEEISLKTGLAAVGCNYLACVFIRTLSDVWIGKSSVNWLKGEVRRSQACSLCGVACNMHFLAHWHLRTQCDGLHNLQQKIVL
jgi:hypothetical protein